ncbi:DUF3592 domain-containing protein [Vibrio sp. WXL210]|uniref:DUF3592 domain-containing protein n=1 Tax=Vibrio sp. WXL210 TaxID=3450709 RepID=UPI003EC6082B
MTTFKFLVFGIAITLLSVYGFQDTKSMDLHGIETQATITGFEVYMEPRGLKKRSKERRESQTHQYVTYTWISRQGIEYTGKEKVRMDWEPPQNGRLNIIYADDPNRSTLMVDVVFRKRNPHRSQFLFVSFVIMGLLGTTLVLACVFRLYSKILKAIRE